MPPATDRRPDNSYPRRKMWRFMVGVVCLQAAWMLCVPAYWGIDEIDHAYRAASVAHGQVAAQTEPVPNGRGSQVKVPESLVRAAEPACERLTYVGRGNCHPVTARDANGSVGIASAASIYMPLYYALVGWPSLFLAGEQALYGMRLVSMLLCTVLIGLAASVASRNRTPWLFAGAMLCLTPTVVYATTLVAPNGLSMAGGVLMWLAWAGNDTKRREQDRKRLWLGTLGAVACILTHNTGPIWVLLTLGIFCYLKSPWRWPAEDRRRTIPALAVIFASMVTSLTWALATGANLPSDEGHAGIEPPDLDEWFLLQPVLWLLQSVFSAPRRENFAEPYVYAIAFALLFSVCAAGFVRANGKVKTVMLLIAATLLALPLILTLLSYRTLGFAWQGRYSIPLGLGITILASCVMSQTTRFRRAHLAAGPAFGLVAVGATLSARNNVAAEGGLFMAPPLIPATLAALGCLAWVACLKTGLDEQAAADGHISAYEASGQFPSGPLGEGSTSRGHGGR